jgi:hypothetical protein
MFSTRGLLTVILAVCFGASASSAQTADRWNSLQFLIGDWAATGDGATGAAAGAYSFKTDLNDQILVRHNYAEYGGTGQQRHDDLLIVYADVPGKAVHAIYFDSEGHVIKYNVTPSRNFVLFESDPAEPGPKYRLSYRLVENKLIGKFEIAESGSAGYKTYLEWTSVRK